MSNPLLLMEPVRCIKAAGEDWASLAQYDALHAHCLDQNRRIAELEQFKGNLETIYNDTMESICDLADTLGFDSEQWDHDSCPNNSDMARELIEFVRAEKSDESARIAQLEAKLKVAREALEKCVGVFDEMDDVVWDENSEWQRSSYENVADEARAALKEGQDTTPATGGGEAS